MCISIFFYLFFYYPVLYCKTHFVFRNVFVSHCIDNRHAPRAQLSAVLLKRLHRSVLVMGNAYASFCVIGKFAVNHKESRNTAVERA